MIYEDRRLVLAARRERLILRAAAQRQQLGSAVVPLARAWVWVERGVVAGQWLRQRAWLVAAPVALLVWRRPQRLLRAAARASALWRAGRSVQRLLGR